MLSNVIVTALAGASFVTTAAAYTPNKQGSQYRYPFAKPYDQSFLDGYSILKHLGGQGPYSNRQSYGISRDPPDGCAVDQLIMLKRHGERWPEAAPAAKFAATLDKIYNGHESKFTDALEFLNRWTYFVPQGRYIALETFNGPYAGLLEAYTHGADYGARYGHLWDPTAANLTIPMFSSGYERILMTARKFGEGFFGWNYTDVVAMNIVPEQTYMGANSLTPACLNDNQTVCNGLTNYQPLFDVAAERINSQSGVKLNSTDIFNLMTMTAYELNVRGASDWVDVFTLDEWLAFGYTQDLSYYYCAGPGDPNMKAVGAVYANASLVLLNTKNDTQKVWLNFAHDTNITPVLAALGLVSPAEDLPLDHIPFPNGYKVSDVMPMGGHLTMERLVCNATAATAADTYVRLILNEAIVPLPKCQDGPGFTCSLSNYTQLVSESLPDFVSTCGVDAGAPQYLDFWWNFNTTRAYDVETQQPIPAGEGLLTYQGTAA